MKRRNFTFSPAYANLHKAGTKAIRILTQRQHRRRKLKGVQQFISQSLQGSSFIKAVAAACLAIALGAPATAQQCNVFLNADAANPITKLLRPGEHIDGLDFVDIDADGDLDCYAKVWEPQYGDYHFPTLFRNKGTATFPVFVRDDNSGFQNTTNKVYSESDVQFADLDGDGDFDCFIAESYPLWGSFGGTTIDYYENVGTPQNPVFVSNEAHNPLGFAYSFYGIGFTLADIDNDGDLDVSVSPEWGFYGETIFINKGTPTSPSFDNGHRDYTDAPLYRVYYDWNKDGLPDHFDDGAYYQNIGPRTNPKYTTDSVGPQFGNGAPYRFVDLNNDGVIEVFNFNGGYSTLAPVAVINAKPSQAGSISYTLLSSANQSPDYKYQWKLNGVDIPKATRPTYPATRTGKYTLTVTGACGTGISLPYIIRQTTGAQSNDALIANATGIHPSVFMQASPNPFTNRVTLRIAQSTGGSTIKVCDLQGRVLVTKQTADAVVSLGETLSRGIYIVQVWQKNGLVFSQKVIKE